MLATAIAALAVPVLAQRQSAPSPDPTASPNPNAATTAAGSGGLNTGRGRGQAAAQGPAPKLPDGRPDFSGVWQGGGPVGDLAQGMPKGEEIPLNEAGKTLMASRQSADDPEANCLPTGVPRTAPYPWRMLQTPTHVFILFEGNIHSYRQIFVDGRKHPDDPDPTWYGHSVGHYEGQTWSSTPSGSTTNSGSISAAIRTARNCTRWSATRARTSARSSWRPPSPIRCTTRSLSRLSFQDGCGPMKS